jgi:hypothetical protein
MERKTKGKKVEHYSDLNPYPEIEAIRCKIARWVKDNLPAIRDARPVLPEIENRNLDNYLPLFQIAQVAGGSWSKLIAEAAPKMINAGSPTQESMLVELLRDIRQIFAETDLEVECTAKMP